MLIKSGCPQPYFNDAEAGSHAIFSCSSAIMLIRLLIAASVASAGLTGTTGAPSQQCMPRASGFQLFRPKYTCGHLTDLEPTPGFKPWTHEPLCRTGKDPDDKGKKPKRKKFCIYTRTNPDTGRGFSILTTPAVARSIQKFTEFDLFDDPKRVSSSPPYEKRALPGRGIGLIATRDIKLGETIMIDWPALVTSKQAIKMLGPRDLQRLVWRGLLQLSEQDQNRTRSLSVSRESGSDQLEEITHTNSIGMMLSGTEENTAVMPEMAVRSCLPLMTSVMLTKPPAH